jgi:hypothetical protein
MKTPEQKAKFNSYMKDWWKRHPEYCKNEDLVKRFGITYDNYMEIYKQQEGVCALCGFPETALDHRTKRPRMLAVDHCHISGNIRGLLCTKCNTGLGNFLDSPDLLEKAIKYIKAGV